MKIERNRKEKVESRKNLGSGGEGEFGRMTGLFESIGGSRGRCIATPRERCGGAASGGGRVLILVRNGIESERGKNPGTALPETPSGGNNGRFNGGGGLRLLETNE